MAQSQRPLVGQRYLLKNEVKWWESLAIKRGYPQLNSCITVQYGVYLKGTKINIKHMKHHDIAKQNLYEEIYTKTESTTESTTESIATFILMVVAVIVLSVVVMIL